MLPRHPRQRRSGRGFSSVYTIMAMVALLGMVSLGVDLGRVYTAKTELQTAADAAARAGAAALGSTPATVRAAASDGADDNLCDGTAVVLIDTDIELGLWDSDTRTFTLLSGSAESGANAVRVTARRLAARDTAIPLTFASLIGKESVDIQTVAIAIGPSSSGLGVVGINQITLGSNARVDSYDSTNGQYMAGTATSNGQLRSNGDIILAANALVNGDARPGPGHAATGGTVTGSREPSTTTLNYPLVDAGPFASNNNNAAIPGTYKVGPDFIMDGNNSYSLPPGTYCFRNFQLLSNVDLYITGPTIIYLTGGLLLESNATIHSPRPQDLRFNIQGTGPVELNSNSILNAVLYAPEASVTLDSGFQVMGAVVAGTLHLSSNARVHFDTTLNSGPGSDRLRLVY